MIINKMCVLSLKQCPRNLDRLRQVFPNKKKDCLNTSVIRLKFGS